MKVRSGFVSNSSSSSFIIELDKPIEEYTLEEFRSVCQSHGKVFDPVEVLYNDLMNKENSKREIYKWEDEYSEIGRRQLKYDEYIVTYSDDTEPFIQINEAFKNIISTNGIENQVSKFSPLINADTIRL